MCRLPNTKQTQSPCDSFPILQMLFLLLSAIATAQAPTYGKCNAAGNYDASVAGIPMEIVPQLTNSPIQVKGQVVIIDNCNFESQNFTFINGTVVINNQLVNLIGWVETREALTVLPCRINSFSPLHSQLPLNIH